MSTSRVEKKEEPASITSTNLKFDEEIQSSYNDDLPEANESL